MNRCLLYFKCWFAFLAACFLLLWSPTRLAKTPFSIILVIINMIFLFANSIKANKIFLSILKECDEENYKKAKYMIEHRIPTKLHSENSTTQNLISQYTQVCVLNGVVIGIMFLMVVFKP